MRTLFGRGVLAPLPPSPPPSRQAPDPEQADARPTYVGVAAARPADMASAAIGTMARPVDLKRVTTGPGVGVMCPAAPPGHNAGRAPGAGAAGRHGRRRRVHPPAPA